jgi:vancomycin permeability regulator SanA
LLRTDSWTSRATESYLTVRAHFITAEWEIKSHVFQTRPIESNQTSVNLEEELREVVAVWKLERDDVKIHVTTDN